MYKMWKQLDGRGADQANSRKDDRSMAVLRRLDRRRSHRDGVTLRLEAVLVGHPVDGDGLAIRRLEAVGTLHDNADLLPDLFGLSVGLHRDGVACLKGVLERSVFVLRAVQPEQFGGLLGPRRRRRHAQAQNHLVTHRQD